MKIPKSISELSTWHKNARYWLALALLVVASLVWVRTTMKVDDGMVWLMWLTVMALAVVAATPLGYGRHDMLHTYSAIVAGVLVTALTALCAPLGLFSWVAYVGYTLATNCKYKVLVAEACCIVEVIILLA